ncbi:NUDIX hydrolase [Halobacteriales archaeon QS_8_69_26]|nr:MAG: NUDIX hydrolase [Halobacteriales archaeon QS_8_69_26]
MPGIQTTVLGIVRRDDEYLVQRLTDAGGDPFYRPIGGGVEFGEASGEALEREFREELDAGLAAGPTVGTIENRFTWGGERQHEWVIARRAAFEDDARYDRDRFAGEDAGGRIQYEATWHTLDALRTGPEPLYPDGLGELLAGQGGTGRGHLPRE